jgi:hypothetical protein
MAKGVEHIGGRATNITEITCHPMDGELQTSQRAKRD